jgi:hypothetical protein
VAGIGNEEENSWMVDGCDTVLPRRLEGSLRFLARLSSCFHQNVLLLALNLAVLAAISLLSFRWWIKTKSSYFDDSRLGR